MLLRLLLYLLVLQALQCPVLLPACLSQCVMDARLRYHVCLMEMAKMNPTGY